MFCVVSCSKFSRQTLRVVDFGDADDPAKLLRSMGPRECCICGPCSHVELSWQKRFTVHGEFDDVEDAKRSAVELSILMPDLYECNIRLEDLASCR